MTDTAPATDTPVKAPASRLDHIKGFIGDLARPWAIIATSTGAAVATVITALRVQNGTDGALLIGAIGVMVGGIYIGKSWEVAKVAVAQTKTPPTGEG